MASYKLDDTSRALVVENERLVHYVVNQHFSGYARYWGMDFDKEDLASEGHIGLCRAAATYDASRGKFSTYATVCIKAAINHYIRHQFRPSNPMQNCISLDATFDCNGVEVCLSEIVADNRSDFTDSATCRLDSCAFFNDLNDVIANIVRYRLDGLTQRQIAERVGFTQSYISRLLIPYKAKMMRCISG